MRPCFICLKTDNVLREDEYYKCEKCLSTWVEDEPMPEARSTSTAVLNTEEETILDEAKRLVHGDRNKSYGPPSEDFLRVAGMMTSLFKDKLKDGASFEPEDVARVYILGKLSRSCNAFKRDNWTDIAGYAECAHWARTDLDTRAGKHPR